MGFPMSVAMTTLGRLGKEHMFIWAWGVNGCFSVIGAAAAPVLATSFGLASVIEVAALAYFVALAGLWRCNVAADGLRGLAVEADGGRMRCNATSQSASWRLGRRHVRWRWPAAPPRLARRKCPPQRPAAAPAQFSDIGGVDVAYVEFSNSAFPYHGDIPASQDASDGGQPFLNVDENGRLGHKSSRGGVHWEDETYNDRHVLVAASPNFDPKAPGRHRRLFPRQQRHPRRATSSPASRRRARSPPAGSTRC